MPVVIGQSTSPHLYLPLPSLGEKRDHERDPCGIHVGHPVEVQNYRRRSQSLRFLPRTAEFRVRSREEVYVTQVYAGMLRRTADPQGYASWRAVLEAGGSGISLIQGFLDSPEYRRRFLP